MKACAGLSYTAPLIYIDAFTRKKSAVVYLSLMCCNGAWKIDVGRAKMTR